MRFIVVHDERDMRLLLNLEDIVAIAENANGCIIHMHDGAPETVLEAFEDIHDAILGANR